MHLYFSENSLNCNYEACNKYYRHAASAQLLVDDVKDYVIVMAMYGPRVKRYPLLVFGLLVKSLHAI